MKDNDIPANGGNTEHNSSEHRIIGGDNSLIRETYWRSFAVLRTLTEVRNLKELEDFQKTTLKDYVNFVDSKWGVKLPWTESEVSELSVTIKLATEWKKKAMKVENNIEELRKYYYNVKLFLDYLLQRLWINEKSNEKIFIDLDGGEITSEEATQR